jgi:sporulation protein YlmC with PRC-barrel domain
MIFAFGATQAAAEQKDIQPGQSMQYQQSDPRAGASGQQESSGQLGTGGQRADQQASAQISRASELMDKKVQNQQGQDLGQVEDLVIGQDGRISYIIISQGGVMGIGDKLIPIPFENAQLSSQQDSVILSNIDKQTLENAPTISQGDWQMLTDPGFERELFSYYGQQSGEGQLQPGMRMRPGASGSQQPSGQGQAQQPGQSPMQKRPGQSGR